MKSELFSYKVRKAIRYRSVLNQSTKIRKIEDLSIGDYVVHYDYGIGQYVGLKTMELSSEKEIIFKSYMQTKKCYMSQWIRLTWF